MGFEELGTALLNMWQKPDENAQEKVASELNTVGLVFGAALASHIYDRVIK